MSLVAGNPAYEQGLDYVKILAVLIFAGSPMSTLTAKFKGCLYSDQSMLPNLKALMQEIPK